MDSFITRTGGLIALGVILYWLWRDPGGTIGIIEAAGYGTSRLISTVEGRNP
jgi:hypothetical protein